MNDDNEDFSWRDTDAVIVRQQDDDCRLQLVKPARFLI
jgi:hypothetical protein